MATWNPPNEVTAERFPPAETVREWIGEGLKAAGGECHRSMVLYHVARRSGLPATPALETWMIQAFETAAAAGSAPYEPRFGPGSHRWRLRKP